MGVLASAGQYFYRPQRVLNSLSARLGSRAVCTRDCRTQTGATKSVSNQQRGLLGHCHWRGRLGSRSESARLEQSSSSRQNVSSTISCLCLYHANKITSPIFFITSYWSDFILVPLKSRAVVIHALEDRGFLFEADLEPDSEAGFMTNPASPLLHSHSRNNSYMSSSFDNYPPTPMTPPPASVSELQQRTFKLLQTHKITPQVIDSNIQLVTCAGIKDNTPSSSYHHRTSTTHQTSTQALLQHGLLKCLTASEPPCFLSLTLTASDSASLTLEKRLLLHFPAGGEDVLLGKDGPEQVPITLDLRELPLESTGIVCGVASRLVDGMRGRFGGGASNGASAGVFEMSYLSTARAGHVVVFEDELEDAIEILQGLGEGSG